MPQRTIECPSGLTITIRGLKGREMKLLSDKKRGRSGELFDDLLLAVTVETLDFGPYKATATGKPNWLPCIVGDRFFTLVKLRAATYPDEPYPFQVSCPCGERIDWEVPLDELPVKMLTPDARERLAAGTPFETEFLGKLIKFRLATGQDERQILKRRRERDSDGESILKSLATRLVDVQGLAKDQFVDWLEDMEMYDLRKMLERFDEQDGGIETKIQVECSQCGRQPEVDLPFGPDFLMPKKQQK